MKTSFFILLLTQSAFCDSAVFTVSKSHLKAAVNSKNFALIRNALKYDGAIGVTNLGEDYEQAVKNLKLSAPLCLKDLRYPEFILPDGSRRTTFATQSSETFTESSDYPPCIAETSSVISAHFDSVFESVAAVFEEITDKDSLTWRDENGSVHQFSQLPRKEHIHVYEHTESVSDTKFAAPFHTDNGVLLMITPFQEHPLQVRSKGGKILDTSGLGNNDLILIIARALPEWLLRGSREAGEFRAGPHAVPTLSPELDSRTVFARMMVAPFEAVAASPDAQKVPFSHVFFNKITQNDLCVAGDFEKQDTLSRLPRDTRNNTDDAYNKLKEDECSDPGSSYCWLGCRDLPTDDCQPWEMICTNSWDVDCCTDPADEGTGKCTHGGSCQWKCGASN